MTNIELLKDLYTEREMKKQAISFFIKKHHQELYNEIMDIDLNYGFLAKAYCFINLIDKNPICNCGKKTTFVSMTQGFSKTCSYKCMGKVDITKLKRKSTTQKKYGVDNISLVTRNKVAEKIRNKTTAEKLEILEKTQSTCLKKFGETNAMKSSVIQLKARKTNLKKYGVEYPTQSKIVIENQQNNNLIKYGVRSVSQIPEVQDKKENSSFKRKEYMWRTGEISLVQGYEPILLKELEEDGYKFNDILTSPKDMPKIMYQLNEKEHRYYPDIFIPKDNIIIEVKSTYTIKCNLEKNKAKFEATRNLGFDFRVEVR